MNSIKELFEANTKALASHELSVASKSDPNHSISFTYKTLHNDVSALGTFLVYCGLKNKNIAILGEDIYERIVSYLAIICGTGTAVPLNKKWELSDLKYYLNATNCDAIIFSEKFESVVWELQNDGSTLLQTYISMDFNKKTDYFISMDEAMDQGWECLNSGNRDFLDSIVYENELAIIKYIMGIDENIEIMKFVGLTNKEIISHIDSSCENSQNELDFLHMINFLSDDNSILT